MKNDSKAINWLGAKYFFSILLPPLVLQIVISIIVFYIEAESHNIIFEEIELNQVKQISKSMANDFNVALSSLIFLADQHELQRLLDGDFTEKKDLNEMILSFSKMFGLFDQIRYLDETGMEIVRINFNKSRPKVVPENQLQSKAKRYYFKDTMRLERGEVYVSSFDLNVEKGEIEQPLKPMIRFGTPVFDKKGKKRGVIILNYFGAKLLSNLDQYSTLTSGNLSLLNSQGFWLKGPSPEYEWGFMYEDRKNTATFGNLYSDSWLMMKSTFSGQFSTIDGMFTFTTIYPLAEASKSIIGLKRTYESSSVRLEDISYYWKIVSHVTPDVLNIRAIASKNQALML